MNRLLYFTSAACVLISLSSNADARRIREVDSDWYPKSEIYIQYGTPTLIELTSVLSKYCNVYGEASGVYFSGESKNYIFTGVPAIGYKFSVNDRWAVGAYFGASMASADLWLTKMENVEISPIRLYNYQVVNYTVMADASLTYWHEGIMSLSGQAYIGISFMDETIRVYDEQDKKYRVPGQNDRWKFAYHLTPIKFRVGEVCGFFAELGFGYRGLVNAGFSAKF